MTPEEKAKELVEDNREKILVQHSTWNVMSGHSFPMPLKFAQKIAIQVAIVDAENIIKAIRDFDDELYANKGIRMANHREYYENVLHYLKNYPQ